MQDVEQAFPFQMVVRRRVPSTSHVALPAGGVVRHHHTAALLALTTAVRLQLHLLIISKNKFSVPFLLYWSHFLYWSAESP